MKLILLIACLYFSITFETSAQPYPLIPDSLQKIFSDDAYFIAFNYINSDSTSAFYNDVTIPENLKKNINDALRSIYLNKFDSSIDSIYNIYKIFEIKTEELNTIMVMPDTSIQWINNIMNKKTRTGNEAVDNLIDRYNCTLKFETFPSLPINFGLIYIILDRPVNINALARKLKSEDLKKIDRLLLVGDRPKDIIYRPLDYGDSEITYFLKWGDCQMGCIQAHKWVVTVSEFGKILDIQSSGDEIPEDYIYQQQ